MDLFDTLGFGLNCAPRIMTHILKKVLNSTETIQQVYKQLCGWYVNEKIISVENVVNALLVFGLTQEGPVDFYS